MAVNDWSEENCIHLIRAYRERPVLWDQKDPFFAKKTVKMDAWQEIGDILNVPADACKNKMVVLLSSFRREKAKIIHSLKNSSDDVYKSTWFGFKEMSFLIDKETERKRQLTGVEDNEDEDGPPSLKKTILKYHFQAPISTNKSMIRISSSTSSGDIPKISRRINDDNTQTQIMSSPQSTPMPTLTSTPISASSANTSTVVTENEEEIRSFTNFVANKMKKYSETTKNAVQQAICEIIFRADQNFYETVCYDNYTSINNYRNSRTISEGHDPLDKSLRIELNEGSIKIDESEESD